MTDSLLPQHFDHPRSYRDLKYAYPVLSRRSHGLSLGINLNPDKICNFDCIYCQVDRRTESELRFVDLPRLTMEVEWSLDWILSGRIFSDPRFESVPDPLRRLNDIAFSGDGEPTTFRNFEQIITEIARLKSTRGLDQTRLVLITNASMFHREHVQRGLELLDANQGEIWAKLDAGTSEYFQLVDRTSIPFQQILDNIREAARRRPLVIQSLFMRVHGQGPSDYEIDEFARRLQDILDDGGQFSLVQIYTVARRPAEGFVEPLADEEVDQIADRVHAMTGLRTECFYGGRAAGS